MNTGTSTGSMIKKATTNTNGVRKSFGPDGCQAITDGTKCGETKNLQIIKEFNRLYEDKMKQIDDIAGGDCIQAKVNLQQEWIKDLTEQNEMLVKVVEELEVAAAERVAQLEKKLQQSAKSAGEKMEQVQNDMNNLLELIKRAHTDGNWNTNGLHFYCFNIYDVIGPTQSGTLAVKNNNSSQKEDMFKEKDRRIKELETQLKPYLESGKKDYDSIKKDYKELEQSMLDMRDALTAEVADKHDAVLCLRREVHLLEEQCRKADQQTHFKDDIIKELRKEIKQLKQHLTLQEKADAKLKEDLLDAKNQLVSMKDRADAYAKERDRFKKELDSTKAELLKAKTSQCVTLKDLKSKLEGSKEEAVKAKEEKSQELAELKGMLKESFTENQNLKEKKEKETKALADTLKLYEEQLKGIKQLHASEIANWRKLLNNSKEEIQTLCNTSKLAQDDFTRKLQNLNLQATTSKNEKDQMMQKLENLQKSHNSYLNNIQSDMLKELETFEQQHGQTLKQLERLRDELEKTKKDHKLCVQKIKDLGEENLSLKEIMERSKDVHSIDTQSSVLTGNKAAEIDTKLFHVQTQDTSTSSYITNDASVNTSATLMKSQMQEMTVMNTSVNTVPIERQNAGSGTDAKKTTDAGLSTDQEPSHTCNCAATQCGCPGTECICSATQCALCCSKKCTPNERQKDVCLNTDIAQKSPQTCSCAATQCECPGTECICSATQCALCCSKKCKPNERQNLLDTFTCANSFVAPKKTKDEASEANCLNEEPMEILELLGPKKLVAVEPTKSKKHFQQMKAALSTSPPCPTCADFICKNMTQPVANTGTSAIEKNAQQSPRIYQCRKSLQEPCSNDMIYADESDETVLEKTTSRPCSFPADYGKPQEYKHLKFAQSSPVKSKSNMVQAKRDGSSCAYPQLSKHFYCTTAICPNANTLVVCPPLTKPPCYISTTTNTVPCIQRHVQCGATICVCDAPCQTCNRMHDASILVRPQRNLVANKTKVIGVCTSIVTADTGTSTDMGSKWDSKIPSIQVRSCKSDESQSTLSTETYNSDTYEDTILSHAKDKVLYLRESCPAKDLENVVQDLNISVSKIMQKCPDMEAKEKVARLEDQLRTALKQKEQAVEYERHRRNQEVQNLKLTIQHMENAIKNKQCNSDNLQNALIHGLKDEITRLKYDNHADAVKISGLKNTVNFYINQANEVKNIMRSILGLGNCENSICTDENCSENLVLAAQEVERFVQGLQGQVNLMLASLEHEKNVNQVNAGRVDELQNILSLKNIELTRGLDMYQDIKSKLENYASRNKKLEDAVIELQDQLVDTELDSHFKEQKVDLCHDELDLCLNNLNSVKLKLRLQCQLMTQKIDELTDLKADFKEQNNSLEKYKMDMECSRVRHRDEVLELNRVIADLQDQVELSEKQAGELNDEQKSVQDMIVNMTQRENKLQQDLAIKDQDFNNKLQVWKVKEARMLEQISQLEQQLRAVHNELAGRTQQIDSTKSKLQQISNDAQMRVQMGQEELLAAKEEINLLRQVHDKLQIENDTLQQTVHALKATIGQHESLNITVKMQLDKCMANLKRIEADKYLLEQKNDKLLQELDKMQLMLRNRCENMLCLEEELNNMKSDRDEIRKESHHVVGNVRAWIEEQKRLNDHLKGKLEKKNAPIIKYQYASSSKQNLHDKKNLPPVCVEVCNHRQRGGTISAQHLNTYNSKRATPANNLWSLNSRGSDTDSPRSSDGSDTAEWFDVNASETTVPCDEPGTEVWIHRVESMTEELQRSNRYWKKKLSDSDFMVTKDK